ncbi:hypothetical protein L1D52_24280 [Vibrio brasiliensis]|uniref:hypothetical protein n=1 Tax=Vibrio brasiliensis TaxID=170652 RepID=UPI001EFDEAAF|nr:hypothetical protein [Vibrio brasiliensis]MCG9785430.1 hypothetical protein [Vibrio brasiliensis]
MSASTGTAQARASGVSLPDPGLGSCTGATATSDPSVSAGQGNVRYQAALA